MNFKNKRAASKIYFKEWDKEFSLGLGEYYDCLLYTSSYHLFHQQIATSDFISSLYIYDTYSRNQNTTGNNHLTLASTNSEIIQRTLDFADNITTENRSHTNSTGPQDFNQRRVYDAQGCLYDFFVSIAGAENSRGSSRNFGI